MKKIISGIIIALCLIATWAVADQEEWFYSSGQATRPQFYNGYNYRAPRIDASTRSINTVDYFHHEIHGGSAFFVSGTTVIASGGSIYLSFAVPQTTKLPHLTLSINSTGILFAYFMENVNCRTIESNLVAGGTPYNHDRNSTTVSGCTVGWVRAGSGFATGTQASGTTLYDIRLGSSGVGQTSLGGSSSRENELILKSGTTYVLLLSSGAANQVGYSLNWYEHTPKDN